MLSVREMLLPLIAVLLVIGPLWFLFRNGVTQKNARHRLLAQIALFAGVMLICVIVQLHAFSAYAAEVTTTSTATASGMTDTGVGYLAAAIAVAASSLGAAWAVAKAAPSALGAISENPDNFGKAIIFVALGEGIAIYGLLISILIINKL